NAGSPDKAIRSVPPYLGGCAQPRPLMSTTTTSTLCSTNRHVFIGSPLPSAWRQARCTCRTINDFLPPGPRVSEPLSSSPAPRRQGVAQFSSGPCRVSYPATGPVFRLQTRVERLASPITQHLQ